MGRQPDLKDLYDRAVWANPVTREKMQKAGPNGEAERREKARKARRGRVFNQWCRCAKQRNRRRACGKPSKLGGTQASATGSGNRNDRHRPRTSARNPPDRRRRPDMGSSRTQNFRVERVALTSTTKHRTRRKGFDADTAARITAAWLNRITIEDDGVLTAPVASWPCPATGELIFVADVPEGGSCHHLGNAALLIVGCIESALSLDHLDAEFLSLKADSELTYLGPALALARRIRVCLDPVVPVVRVH